MSLIVVELSHGADLVSVGAVSACVLSHIAPACVEALQTVSYYLIAVHSVLVYAELSEVEYLSDTHVVGNDSIIEIRFVEGILDHFRNIIFLVEGRVTVSEGSNSGLHSAIGMGRINAEAVELSSLDVSTVTVSPFSERTSSTLEWLSARYTCCIV